MSIAVYIRTPQVFGRFFLPVCLCLSVCVRVCAYACVPAHQREKNKEEEKESGNIQKESSKRGGKKDLYQRIKKAKEIECERV